MTVCEWQFEDDILRVTVWGLKFIDLGGTGVATWNQKQYCSIYEDTRLMILGMICQNCKVLSTIWHVQSISFMGKAVL